MNRIAVNARFYAHPVTGMQRYARELSSRFGGRVDALVPKRAGQGIRGHLWEQAYLPLALRGRLLWSPNNTGPVTVSKQVCTIHDLAPLERPEWFNAKFVSLYEWLLPRLVRRVRHIIAVSNFTRERIIERYGVPPEKVTAIASGVGTEFSPRPPEEVEAMRRDLGITGKRYLVAVGCVVPRKNIPRVVQAWAEAQKRLDADVELVIAGRNAGSMTPGYRLDELPPRTRLLGYVPERYLAALYTGATAALCVSLYEGFGLTPLEAMACGTPVIASNQTAIPEVVGDAAILVDPNDAGSIAAGMCDLLEDEELRSSLRCRSAERARRYCWDRTAALTWQVLERFAGNN